MTSTPWIDSSGGSADPNAGPDTRVGSGMSPRRRSPRSAPSRRSRTPTRTPAAADLIRKLNEEIQTGKVRGPRRRQDRVLVPGANIGEDRNWSALVEILREDGWEDGHSKTSTNPPRSRSQLRILTGRMAISAVVSCSATCRAERHNFTAVIAKAGTSAIACSSSCRASTTLCVSRRRTA